MTNNPANLQELYDQLNGHDWFYGFSDDHRVWTAGNAEKARLRSAAASIDGGLDLYNAFHNHHFSGKPWGTEKQSKPERPA